MSRFRKLSLIRQIIFLILLMLLILLTTFVISDMIAKRIVERKVTESVSKIFLQVEEKMVSFNSDIEGIFDFLFYSPTIQQYLGTEDDLERILMNREVVSMFANTVSLKKNIRGIQLFDKDGNIIASLGNGTVRTVPSPIQSIEYSGLLTTPLSDHRDSKRSFYAISTPIYQLDQNRLVRGYKGIGRFFMDATNFSPILESAKITPNSRVLLIDTMNNIIAAEGPLPPDQTVFHIEQWENNKQYIVQTITLPRSGWKLISLIPRYELLEDMDMVKRFNIVTYSIMFFILCIFLFIFFTRILKPIKELMDFMKSFSIKGGESRFNIVYHNEIGVLGSNLNSMLDNIDMLSKEVQSTQARMYEMELAKKQMEISAFRNQINPHFLYNTLESIRAVALIYDVQEIADISASMSNMFRYAVKGSNFVTVREEIEHVNEYSKIIDFRFRGRFQIEIDTDERLMSECMLKMLLQPIVENAVFHGLERRIGKGKVHIRVYRTDEGQIGITIQDDGHGMDEVRYSDLTSKLHSDADSGALLDKDTGKGIGLLNIYRRMKLFYGDAADMKIWSRLHEGTTVSITFPMIAPHIEEVEEKLYVPSYDRGR
ncbi:sensor histidine kinase [Paenibacillus tarimensis]